MLFRSEDKVKEYVLKHEITQKFIEKLMDMITFLIPNYIKEGKRQLIISIGCTGGRHRSVAIATELNEMLMQKKCNAKIEHRDIDEDLHKGARKL